MTEGVIDSGARVRLKTGSPPMTTGQWGRGPRNRGKIECSWFDNAGRSHSDFFHPSQLELMPDDEPSGVVAS